MNALDQYRGVSHAEPVVLDAESVPVHSEPSDRLDLLRLVSAFRRRLQLFILVVALFVAAALGVTSLLSPKYDATSRVMVDTRQPQVTPDKDETAPRTISDDDATIDTEVEVLRSRALAERLAANLKLDQDPRFNPLLAPPEDDGLLSAAKSVAGPLFGRGEKDKKIDATEAHAVVVDRVLAGLKVKRVGATYAIDITFRSADPAFASKIANAYALTYAQQQLDDKSAANRQALEILSQRVQQLSGQALDDAARVQQYRLSNNLPTTTGASLAEQEISAYNQQVAQARVEAAADLARLKTAQEQLARGSTGEDVAEALNSGVVQALRTQRAGVSAKLASIAKRYGPNHPEILNTQEEITDIDSQIQAEINRVVSNLEAKADVSRKRLDSIEGSLAGARASLSQNNRSLVGLNALEQKATASQAQYESYLNRYKAISAKEGAERADARVISMARTPLEPSSPNLPLNLVLGLLLGLGGGIAAIYVAETVDASLTTVDDVERRLGRLHLASVPALASLKGLRGVDPASVVVRQPRSAFAEAFRNLRASLAYSLGRRVQIVAFTSALPGEGKTITSTSFARIAAQQGIKVVLVDCDLRRRSLNKLVCIDRDRPDLVSVLARGDAFEEALVQDDITGLKILPLGYSEGCSESLLTGDAMARLLDQLRESFDMVVLDTAPILPVADVLALAPKADALVMVVRWRRTSEHAVRAALRMLPRGHAPTGVLLNQINMRKQAKFGLGDPASYFRRYKSYYS